MITQTLDPTQLPRYDTFELGTIWNGRGRRVSVTFRNSYDTADRTVQGRAFYNAERHTVAVRAADVDTFVPLDILKFMQA
jgi:hypothetical protein